MKSSPRYLLLTLFSLSLSPALHAAVIVTYAESPTATNSSLSGTSVLTFNTMALGRSTNVAWNGVGTFDQLYIKNADSYGGAADAANPNGTRYSVQGAGTSVSSSTLSLNASSGYFGMWWSAGDVKNVLDFYSGNTLVAQFTTASLMDPLPATYDGNPRNRLLDRNEPFAFLNFFADATTSWDRVVLRNSGSSGFESDNYTSRVAAWNPLVDGALPGVPVAIVSGTTSTKTTASSLAGSRWASVPGAPAPPLPLLVVFALALGFKKHFTKAPAL
jgi:hypothetical protein